jgi:methylated-DNA-[protein]-cysteine S-methyltransferase
MAANFSYSVYESPIGFLYIASGANGVTDLSIGANEADFVRDVASRNGVAPSLDNGRNPGLFSELDEYFLGRPTSFSVPLNPSGSAFDTLVWKALLAIPWGYFLSYGELAEAIGTPGAARAVGLRRKKPHPIIIMPQGPSFRRLDRRVLRRGRRQGKAAYPRRHPLQRPLKTRSERFSPQSSCGEK